MLHRRFHKRTPSNPASPVLDRAAWDTTVLQPAQLIPTDGVPAPDVRPRSSTSLPFAQAQAQPSSQALRDQNPPVLPPITRVVSTDSVQSAHSQSLGQNVDQKSPDDPKPLPRSPHNEQSGFLGGLALRNYRREQGTMNQPSAANLPLPTSNGKTPAAVNTAKAVSSFVSGKRPPGTRMASEPCVVINPPVPRDPSKAKKGLPFLKNPMSTLLLRRKTSQNIPDLSLPLRNKGEESTYDPRIKGTLVHDFSAPRPRKPIVQSSHVGSEPTNAGDGNQQYNSPRIPPTAPPVPPKDDRARSSRTSSVYSKGHSTDATLNKSAKNMSGAQLAGARVEEDNLQSRSSSAALSKAAMSRKVSVASAKSSFSAIPRHMKSTSSRFSFDMVGQAEQEKLLEERHRQRQQDKISGVAGDRRDSRFDEFDEDAFDYDAMDYDDGLEERIPGVNADFDDDEGGLDGADDPDNDQDNFAGFVFQRSDPSSSLTSPHSAGLLPTPRDDYGNAIGYAQTGPTPRIEQYPGSSLNLVAESCPIQIPDGEATTGLGIEGLQPVMQSPGLTMEQSEASRTKEKAHLSKDDELYFDDGLIHDFDGEGDGSTFDESIFDINDTDQYGRPIQGMFANALAQRNAALEMKKRESDMTSRLSSQSVVSHSTAHTSLSADMRSKTMDGQEEADAYQVFQTQGAEQALPSVGEIGYQNALAAAVHKATASGKFRRDSSPDQPAGLTITSSSTSGSSHSPDAVNEDPLADYENDDYEYDDSFLAGIDDYELDDDAIIAEANASALANDADDYYGEEFGFYSAPLPQPGHAQSVLSEKNLYQYSHGGYFGPSGVSRTFSGRAVSREPNLTPITERSEYSNRNSVMSIGWPQGSNSGGAIQSPGLAQLAMATEDTDMSISGLLRLRNRAWGGSQASLASSRDGSPYDRIGATSPLGQELGASGLGRGRKNSTFSIYSQDSTGAGSDNGSPTLTMAMANVPTNSIPSLAMSPSSMASPVAAPLFSPLVGPTAFPPLSEVDEPGSPESICPPTNENTIPIVDVPSKQRPSIGHKHTGSAGSVSYIKKEDSGETRWILERRRTGETGETEILEREVVGAGRI
ncbi:hypothetical protein F4802DRAFT_555700 [Xylaria palmicola]|nr:hypothetical protein F4802DRAFT_555700 [Xylaria palmicola]